MKIDDTFSLMYELVDIDTIEEVGYHNCYDISVTGNETFLLDSGIVSHNSATGGLMPVLGRDNIGYFELKGKPLNVYKATQKEFQNNEELSLLYQIANNEGYEKIIWGTDQDLDGFHIRGLLNGFVIKYLPEHKNKIGMLNTPVIIISKNKKPVRWSYNLSDEMEIKPGETSKYFKGLGTHTKQSLTPVVEKDGLENMIEILEFDDDSIILDWLEKDRVEQRKDYIQANEFSIAKM